MIAAAVVLGLVFCAVLLFCACRAAAICDRKIADFFRQKR